MKWLIKLFMPSAKAMSDLAADKLTERVNALDGSTADKIAQYAQLASTITATANKLTAMLNDGKIDESEHDAIAATLEPVFAKVLEAL